MSPVDALNPMSIGLPLPNSCINIYFCHTAHRMLKAFCFAAVLFANKTLISQSAERPLSRLGCRSGTNNDSVPSLHFTAELKSAKLA